VFVSHQANINAGIYRNMINVRHALILLLHTRVTVNDDEAFNARVRDDVLYPFLSVDLALKMHIQPLRIDLKRVLTFRKCGGRRWRST